MGRLLSLAAGVVLDVGPADAVTVAADAGWPAAGIWFDPDSWTEATAREVRRRLDDTGLVALDIEPVLLSDDGDPGDRLIEAAMAIGARNVLVASRTGDRDAVTERFAGLCDLAAPGGVTVVLEFLPIFGIRSLAEAVGIVTAAGRPNGGILVDNLHLSRSGGAPADVADVAAVDPTLLPYLQLCDAVLPPPTEFAPLLEEALHGRLLPGEGQLPIDDLLGAVPDVPLSVELRSRPLMEGFPDPTERARAVLAATKATVADR